MNDYIIAEMVMISKFGVSRINTSVDNTDFIKSLKMIGRAVFGEDFYDEELTK